MFCQIPIYLGSSSWTNSISEKVKSEKLNAKMKNQKMEVLHLDPHFMNTWGSFMDI